MKKPLVSEFKLYITCKNIVFLKPLGRIESSYRDSYRVTSTPSAITKDTLTFVFTSD